MAASPRSQILDASTDERRPAVVPVLRYRNLPAAIDWLCRAFGFERHRVTVDGDGTLLFAQLTFGSSLIMISPVRASAFDKLMRQPDEVGWVETQVCYFFVPDARAHCARAREKAECRLASPGKVAIRPMRLTGTRSHPEVATFGYHIVHAPGGGQQSATGRGVG